VGNEAKNDPSKDFLAANDIGRSYEAYTPASYMKMMMQNYKQ
jgi:hypothetical protein